MFSQRTAWRAALAAVCLALSQLQLISPAAAQAPPPAPAQKPNILFIMGDDIGWMQPSIYHRGLMVGETPNIDQIGNEGAIFMTYMRSRVALPDATRFSPACTRCAPA